MDRPESVQVLVDRGLEHVLVGEVLLCRCADVLNDLGELMLGVFEPDRLHVREAVRAMVPASLHDQVQHDAAILTAVERDGQLPGLEDVQHPIDLPQRAPDLLRHVHVCRSRGLDLLMQRPTLLLFGADLHGGLVPVILPILQADPCVLVHVVYIRERRPGLMEASGEGGPRDRKRRGGEDTQGSQLSRNRMSPRHQTKTTGSRPNHPSHSQCTCAFTEVVQIP
mmetsp:Transcript_14884/g.34240  ORF Transcript_14884/g.34240 Transcript_14884/m.34240 type:complete len:224 (-) Transcript_14884:16-687(-)|eukprot:651556-Hanusia_phi.AAC.5